MDNFDFVPKSLDDIDNMFFENERSLESGNPQADEPAPAAPANANPPAPPQRTPYIPNMNAPQNMPYTPQRSAPPQRMPYTQDSNSAPRNMPYRAPGQYAAPQQQGGFNPPSAQRDSLLPKPMLYKAAPMQTPIDPQGDSPYVMPKDYAIYGREAGMVPPAPQEPEREKPRAQEKDDSGEESTHSGAKAVLSILLVLIVLATTVIGTLAVYYNSEKQLFGKYVCSVEANTNGPVLSKGDIVFVKPVKSLKNGMIVAVVDKETKTYGYYTITDIKKNTDTADLTVTVKNVDRSNKVNEKVVSSALIKGDAGSYFPSIGRVVAPVSRHKTVYLTAAGTAAFILFIVILIIDEPRRKKKRDED